MLKRIGWAIWAVIPVVAMAYHFGPGQDGVRMDEAASMLDEARQAEDIAVQAQADAHAAQLRTFEARKKALLSDAPGDERAVEQHLATEEDAYAAASEAWKIAADKYSVVEQLLQGSDKAVEIRWAKARAMVRAGEIYNGIDELQAIIDGAELAGRGDDDIAVAAREELAAAHYYGARILRDEGRPASLWMESSGVARQQYRYLAERAASRSEPELADDLQRNLERVLDLEQLAQSELVGRPLPKDSPRGRRPGDREPGDGQGRSNRPPQQPGGNGAGGLLEIGPGW